jgi:hypothetical protein
MLPWVDHRKTGTAAALPSRHRVADSPLRFVLQTSDSLSLAAQRRELSASARRACDFLVNSREFHAKFNLRKLTRRYKEWLRTLGLAAQYSPSQAGVIKLTRL